MNQTVTINISGIIFHIEIDAYEDLKIYLNKIKSYFKNSEECEEIMTDIEARIAELFSTKISDANQVILKKDVEEIIAIMGKPEQYIDEDEENINEETKKTYTSSKDKKVFRNPDERTLGGVCSGLAAYFGFDAIWLRLFFVLATIFWGFGPLLYIILWIVIPEAKTASDKLKMRGENVNIDNIGKTFKEGAEKVSENLKKVNTSKLGHVLEEISGAILSILAAIFKVASKVLGVACIIFGVFWLIALLGMLLGSETIFSITPNGVFSVESSEFFSLIFVSEDQFNIALVGAIITFLIPILALIYGGLKLLIKLKTHYSVAITAWVLWVIGIIMCGMIAIKMGTELTHDEEVVKTEIISSDVNDFYLHADNQENPGKGILEDRYAFISLDDDSIYQSYIRFNIHKSKDTSIYIKTIKSSNGNSKKDAINKANQVNYNYSIKDNSIYLSNYFSTLKKNKIRGQQVRIALYLPIGSFIYLDKSIEDLIYDIDNVTNVWDHDMVGKKWVMLEDGLTCLDCDDIGGITSDELELIKMPNDTLKNDNW